MRDKNGTPTQAEVEAEQWFAVMQSGAPTAREAADFTAWRRADPEHDRAYHALEDAWRRAGEHADHPEMRRLRTEALSRAAPGKPPPILRRWFFSFALFVVLLMLLVAIVL